MYSRVVPEDLSRPVPAWFGPVINLVTARIPGVRFDGYGPRPYFVRYHVGGVQRFFTLRESRMAHENQSLTRKTNERSERIDQP